MKLETLFSKAEKTLTPIKTKVLCITPAFALACLKDLNNSNRPMSRSVANLYANEMLRGQWKCNGEPIIFSVDAEGEEHLISGQHRTLSSSTVFLTTLPTLWTPARLAHTAMSCSVIHG
jgi:hypothetical protein